MIKYFLYSRIPVGIFLFQWNIISMTFCFYSQKHPSPSEVVQWSNHCVMEWLRAVDLAEYAPNLRGSGVHGGLIVSTAKKKTKKKTGLCYLWFYIK